jgi:hypothetical protein
VMPELERSLLCSPGKRAVEIRKNSRCTIEPVERIVRA